MATPQRRLHLIANSRSGRGNGAELADIAKTICAAEGAVLKVYQVNEPSELAKRAQEAVDNSVDENDIIVAAGGDGTLRTVAEIMRGAKATYAVVPSGTFNYFARAHKIPENPTEALKLALTGKPKPIRLGEINGRTFVINASLGLYAKSIQEREAKRKIFGRFKIVSVISTGITLLGRHKNLHVKMNSDDFQKEFKTPMIFIGNNALQLRNLSLSVADGFKENKLAIVMLKPVKGLEMLRVLFRGIFKTLEHEERLSQFSAESLKIETKIAHQKVALDGEMFSMKSPYEIKSTYGEVKMISLAND